MKAAGLPRHDKIMVTAVFTSRELPAALDLGVR